MYWRRLVQQTRPADHIEGLRPYLPSRYSPLQSDGRGLQGVYLTEVPAPLMAALADLIGREARDLLAANRSSR